MKVRLMAEITDDSGKKVTAPIEIEREIPSIEEFGEPSEFYETFDRYERPVLEARAELMEKLAKEYLDLAALKKDGSKQEV